MKKSLIVAVVLVHLVCINCIAFDHGTPPSLKLEKGKKYYVVLMAGQSNMVGAGKIEELESYEMPDNILYFNHGQSHTQKIASGRFGPDVSVSKMLSNKFPSQNFILYKYAIGGSSQYDWAPDYDPEKAKITGNPQFGNIYKRFLSVYDSISNGYNVEVVAFLWMQGEADSKKPEAAKEYYNNFKKIIEAVRRDFNKPELPVLFGKVNPSSKKFVALETVVSAQNRIAIDVKNTFLIETDGIEKGNDGVHYNTAGQLELGKRFGDKLIKALPKIK